MAEHAGKPKVRFAGFTEDWEQRKLGDVAKLNNGKDYKHLGDGNIPVYGTGGYMLSVNQALSYKDDAIGIGRKGTIDKPYILKAPFWTVDTLFYSIPNDKTELNFLFATFQKVDWKAADESTGVPSLSKSTIENIITFFPSLPEQARIGAFFCHLDRLVTLHQRKRGRLENIKKAMLEKMFPKNGADVPEVRFAGFTEAWEQRKCKNVCSISTGKSNTQDHVENGRYPFYVRSPIVERSNRYLFDEEAVLTVGDGVGTGKVFHYINGKYDLHQRVYRMYDFSQDVSAKYFYYYFSKNFYDRVMAMTAKTSVDSVRYEMIAEMDLNLPKIQEQRQIALFFSHLDHLVTLHQRKVALLQNIKKACLEKMFV